MPRTPPQKPLTLRERQSQKAAREKAMRKWMDACWRRLLIALAVAMALASAALGVWEWRAEGVSRTYAAARDGVYAATARAGFHVSTLYLDGRARTPLSAVEQALALHRGAPILALSLDEMRARLEALPTVKRASVERALPGTLYVHLDEREPVAVWQSGGRLTLIDDGGTVMPDLKPEDYASLPLVIGEGAPEHIGEALALAEAAPDLAPQVAAMTRVGDRRWNVRLKSGIEIKLPEEGAREAWERLAALHKSDQVLSRAALTVDLRQEGRMVFRLLPAATQGENMRGTPAAQPSPSARET